MDHDFAVLHDLALFGAEVYDCGHGTAETGAYGPDRRLEQADRIHESKAVLNRTEPPPELM